MGGMARHGHHLHRSPQQLQLVAPLHRVGLQGDAGLIGAVGDHGRLGPTLQQPRCAADVVVVVMGLQDGAELQAPLLQPGDHRLGHGWVHHHGWAVAIVLVHTLGSIAATLAGYGLFRLLVRS